MRCGHNDLVYKDSAFFPNVRKKHIREKISAMQPANCYDGCMKDVTNVTEGLLFTIKDLYDAVRKELSARNIQEGAIQYDSNEDDLEDEELDLVYEWITYQYIPENESGLDIIVTADNDDEIVQIAYGPVWWTISLWEIAKTPRGAARQIVDAIQMGLNGQMAINLTIREQDKWWQAAEQVWIDRQGDQLTIATISNHMFFKTNLVATVLRNNMAYALVALRPNDFLHPKKVAGEYIAGREIDLSAPTPLTRKMYQKQDNSVPVQLMGGDKEEPLWQVFYRRLEFWLACLVIGLPLIWFVVSIPDGQWWSVLAVQGVGLVGMLLITFVTSFALIKRQAIIDSGKQPLTERIEALFNYRLISLTLAAILAGTLYFVPLWTPRSAHSTLIAGYASPELILPLGISVALMVMAMVLPPRSRTNKIVRTILMAVGFAGMLYCNFGLMYGGDDSPDVAWWAVSLIVGIPIGAIIWYVSDCFRPVGKEKSIRTWQK